MARYSRPLSGCVAFAGGLAGAVVLALTFGAALALILRAGGTGGFVRADWVALRFTLFQALLSASLSVLCAIPLARALARRDFSGRGLLIGLMGAPFILPVIVAVYGLLAIWGRSGLFSDLLAPLGLGPIHIYGLPGILLAHIFFNIPLVTRLLLQGWASIPGERFRLAAQLGFTPWDMLKRIEWPMLRAVVPGAFLVVFLLCVTSFAIILTLGGGPKSSTIELAIYQAVRLEFDLGKAALLALVQLAICLVAAGLSVAISGTEDVSDSIGGPRRRWDRPSRIDPLVILLGGLFLLLPLGAVVAEGLPAILNGLPDRVWSALWRSVWVALGSTALCGLLGLSLALLILRSRFGRLVETLGVLTLAASPFVMGTGLFLMIRPFANPLTLGLPVTALVNAAMSLPFLLRAVLPALRQAEARHGALAAQLGLGGLTYFRAALWPSLRTPLGFGLGLAAALAMGDLGVITLFADPNTGTLPLLMYDLMGSYRGDDAAGVALILLSSSLGLFLLFERLGRI
ncbi:thiamine/thiamine pyrophosphate ABC transporter permease ThiP [Paracoccaceae bacterium GXU_MW_L88]